MKYYVSIVLLCLIYCSKCSNLKEIDPLLTAGLFEGDIAGVSKKNLHKAVNNVNLWSDGKVPYKIDPKLSFVQKRAIQKAFNQIQSESCVRFVPFSTDYTDYVSFVPGKGCSSSVGLQGGEQQIVVGIGCDTVGIVLHLLMHTLGFWHEESREDRDQYLLINENNLKPDKLSHFQAYSSPKSNHFGESFDYKSIMHIWPYAYAKDEFSPTILAKDERYELGQRLALSQVDKNKIVKAYCGRRQAIIEPTSDSDTLEPRNPQQLIGALRKARPCEDRATKCALWATQGHCYKRQEFMNDYCQGSCRTCKRDTKCENYNSLCGVWASNGRCTKGAGTTVRNFLNTCPLACSVCLPPNSVIPPEEDKKAECRNYNPKCQIWSEKGKCFYRHVSKLCPEACQKCGGNIIDNVFCADRNPTLCRILADKGKCRKKRVRRRCGLSCGICDNEHS